MKIFGKSLPWLATILAVCGFLFLSQLGFGIATCTKDDTVVADISRKSTLDFLDEKFYKKPTGTVRVATMNCYDYLTENRYIDGEYVVEAPKPLSERKAIHRIVKLVNPDVLLLQEIGEEEHLYQLAEDLKNVGVPFSHAAFMQGRDTHRRLAILSKIPFDEILKYPMTDNMTRGLLGVKVNAQGELVEIYVAHLKSRITRKDTDPECRRERLYEVKYVRGILEKRKNGWILGGDFNDDPGSDAIAVLLRGSFARRLDARDSAGEVWTFWNARRGYEFVFDHIFVSPEIFRFYVPASARIVDAKLSEDASDHRVVFADFCFNRK